MCSWHLRALVYCFSDGYISLSRIVYRIRRSFQDESSSQSLCHPSGSHPSLGGWNFPTSRQQRSVDTFPLPWSLYQNGELNCWLKISARILQATSRARYIDTLLNGALFASLQKLRWMPLKMLLTRLLLLQVRILMHRRRSQSGWSGLAGLLFRQFNEIHYKNCMHALHYFSQTTSKVLPTLLWYHHSYQKYTHLQLVNCMVHFLSVPPIRWVFGRTQGPTHTHTCKKWAGIQAQCP